MILFISPYQNALDCAELIERSTREPVKIVNSIRLALAALHVHEFTTVVADENLLECSPGSADTLVQRMGAAMPVFVDMACLRSERVAKMVDTAYRRRGIEGKIARQQAASELRSELKGEVTGLLLSSEMAIKTPDLPASAAERLVSILDIAKRIKERLDNSL
jgi:hypothetical protein